MSTRAGLPDAMRARLGPLAASRLERLDPRVDLARAGLTEGELSSLLRPCGLEVFPALVELESAYGGLEHVAPEYGDQADSGWSWGVRGLLPRDGRSYAGPGGLVPVASHPDGTLFLQEDGGIVGHYDFRLERIRMADGVDVFLRRQLNQWFTSFPYAHPIESDPQGWAERLGLDLDAPLSDSLERWWSGRDAQIQEVTRGAESVLQRARFDQGFDGRRTLLWASTEEALATLVARARGQ